MVVKKMAQVKDNGTLGTHEEMANYSLIPKLKIYSIRRPKHTMCLNPIIVKHCHNFFVPFFFLGRHQTEPQPQDDNKDPRPKKTN